MMDGSGALAAVGEVERHALAYFAIRLHETGFGFALLFFSGFCAAIGVLIFRSRLVPRAIGVMMVLAGISYCASSLAMVVSPALARALFPWNVLPCLVGEISLATWLLVKGVDVAHVGTLAERD